MRYSSLSVLALGSQFFPLVTVPTLTASEPSLTLIPIAGIRGAE